MTDASHARIDSLDAYKSNDLLAADLEQTSEWIQTLYQHCLRGNGPLNIAGTPGCTYVYQRHTHWLGVEHIIPATNYFSSFSSVSAQPAALDCSLICQDLFDSNWHMATLCLADEADPLMQHCQSYLTTQGLPYQLNRMFTNWQLRWSDSVAAYFAQLPSQLRNTLTRKKNKLAKQGLDWRCQLLTTREEFDQHFHEYRAIYELSWKPKEEHIDFIEAFSQQAAQNGWLRMGILYLDEQPAAAQIWFHYQGKTNIFKLAYDPAYADYSVGSLLTEFLMRHALGTDRAHLVDFGMGDEPYKAAWMNHKNTRYSITCFNTRRFFGKLAYLRFEILPRLKRRLLK